MSKRNYSGIIGDLNEARARLDCANGLLDRQGGYHQEHSRVNLELAVEDLQRAIRKIDRLQAERQDRLREFEARS